MAGFDDVSENVRKLVLAGVGAVALGAEKSHELLGDLAKKGAATVEQGKAENEEFLHKISEATSESTDGALKLALRLMNSDQRRDLADRIRRLSDELDEEPIEVEVEVVDEDSDEKIDDAQTETTSAKHVETEHASADNSSSVKDDAASDVEA